MAKIKRSIHQFRFGRLIARKPTIECFINMLPLFSRESLDEFREHLKKRLGQ